MAEIEVQGLERLMKKLAVLGGDVDEVLSNSLMQGGKMVQANAKALCRSRSKQLINSIEVKKEKQGRVSVGTNAEHAAPNEFGTGEPGDPSVPHTEKKFWRYQDADGNWYTTHGMKPMPFLAPALHDNEDNVLNGIVHELQGAIQKAGGGHG